MQTTLSVRSSLNRVSFIILVGVSVFITDRNVDIVV